MSTPLAVPFVDFRAHVAAHRLEIDAAVARVLDSGWFILGPEGEAFDPNHHEAVAHDPGDGEAVVSEVLRPGYVWKGRVLRPAMVRVRG